MKRTAKGGVKKTQQAKADKDRFFFREHLAADVQKLLTDFPGLADPNYQHDVVEFLSKQAGIKAVHTVNLDGMVEARTHARAIIENTLPAIYRLCASHDDSGDNWPALRRAYTIMIRILKYLKDNMECVLNQGLEEAINMIVHQRGEFGIELYEIKKWLEHKYKIPLKRGPKTRAIGDTQRMKIQTVYQQIMEILGKDFTYWTIWPAVEWCNNQLDSGKTLDVEGTTEDLHKRRKPNQVAIFLTSKVTERSISTVERAIRRH